MSKHPRKKKSQSAAVQRSAQQQANDRGIYGVIIMVGLFGLGLWWLASDETFPHAVLGYIVAVLGIVNWCAFKAWRGMELAGWQKSLARLPMRFAGYGTRTGKPIEAAHDQDNARSALLISVSLAIVIIVAASLLLLR